MIIKPRARPKTQKHGRVEFEARDVVLSNDVDVEEAIKYLKKRIDELDGTGDLTVINNKLSELESQLLNMATQSQLGAVEDNLKSLIDDILDKLDELDLSGGGTTNHAALTNLSYALSGHAGFQEELEAGENITITNNVISASATGVAWQEF